LPTGQNTEHARVVTNSSFDDDCVLADGIWQGLDQIDLWVYRSNTMNHYRYSTMRLNSLLLLTSALVVACAKDEGTVRIDGSSTVFPIMSAVGTQFQKAELTKVAIAVSGTTGGFRKFCAGETDISGASRPITSSEEELCRKNGIAFVEVPVAYDGLSVLVNPRNDWARDITVSELKAIWEPEAQAKVTRWSQVRAGWPDKELHLYGAGVDSGTYDYFTEAVVGTQHSSRSDYTSS